MHRLTNSATVLWVSLKRGSTAKPWILYRREESRSWPQAGSSQRTSVALQGDKTCPPQGSNHVGTHMATLPPSVRLKQKPRSWGMHFLTTTKMHGANSVFFEVSNFEKGR